MSHGLLYNSQLVLRRLCLSLSLLRHALSRQQQLRNIIGPQLLRHPRASNLTLKCSAPSTLCCSPRLSELLNLGRGQYQIQLYCIKYSCFVLYCINYSCIVLHPAAQQYKFADAFFLRIRIYQHFDVEHVHTFQTFDNSSYI